MDEHGHHFWRVLQAHRRASIVASPGAGSAPLLPGASASHRDAPSVWWLPSSSVARRVVWKHWGPEGLASGPVMNLSPASPLHVREAWHRRPGGWGHHGPSSFPACVECRAVAWGEGATEEDFWDLDPSFGGHVGDPSYTVAKLKHGL